MSIELTQMEADELIAMQKHPSDQNVVQLPPVGEHLEISLISLDRTEDFLLDVTRSRIGLSKITYQNRGRVVVVLMRLDLNGAPHRNPDGEQMPCPHLHIYREGFGDKWAFPLPAGKFLNLGDMTQTLSDFMGECNVTAQPAMQTGLF